jgi:hypothetical protein
METFSFYILIFEAGGYAGGGGGGGKQNLRLILTE